MMLQGLSKSNHFMYKRILQYGVERNAAEIIIEIPERNEENVF